MFTQICQQDYNDLYLGNTKVKYSKYGCLSAVVNMGYNFLFEKNEMPPEFIKKLKYTSAGLLSWDLSKVGMKLYQSVRQTATPYSVIDKWWPNPNVCCALEIKNGAHFVWQISRYYPGLGYRVVDPWTGKKAWQKYNITGCRIFGKK